MHFGDVYIESVKHFSKILFLILSSLFWTTQVFAQDPPATCEHEPENYNETPTERMLGGRTVQEYVFGENDTCLRRFGVEAASALSNEAVYNYTNMCSFRPVSEAERLRGAAGDIRSMTANSQAARVTHDNLERMVGNFFQDLASRSHAQLTCRIDTTSLYLQNEQKKQETNNRARRAYENVRERIMGLIELKRRELADSRRQLFDRNRLTPCTVPRAGGDGGNVAAAVGCGQAMARDEAAVNARFEAAVVRELIQIPYGYEPAVANAILGMAASDPPDFNAAAFESAMYEVDQNYRRFSNYYQFVPGTAVTQNGRTYQRYCISNEFKRFAVSQGIAEKLFEAYPTNVMNPTMRAIVQCKVTDKYGTAPDNADSAANTAFMVGGGIAAVLTAIPTGGGSLGVYAAAAGIGFSLVSLANQLQVAYRACSVNNYVVSATGPNVCNPEQELDGATSEFSLSNCLTQSGLAAVEAVPIPLDIRAAVRSRVANEIVVTGSRGGGEALDTGAEAGGVARVAGDGRGSGTRSADSAGGGSSRRGTGSGGARNRDAASTGSGGSARPRSERPRSLDRRVEANRAAVERERALSDVLSSTDQSVLSRLNLESLSGRSVSDVRRGAGAADEVAQTRSAVNRRLNSWSEGNRREVMRFLESLGGTGARRRDNYFAILINSSNDDVGNVLARIRRAETNEAGRQRVIRELDESIDSKTREITQALARGDTEGARLLARERSALEVQRTIIDLRDDVQVRGLFSSNTHNRHLETAYNPPRTPHSTDDTFNLDVEVVNGERVQLCRGSYATERGISGLAGGFLSFCRTSGYHTRSENIELGATPYDANLPETERGYSRYQRFTARPGTRFSIGQNREVSYNAAGEAYDQTGGIGGGLEVFCSRSNNCTNIGDLSASVRTPTCNSRESSACRSLFSIQESVRVDTVASRGTPEQQLTYLRENLDQVDRVIARMDDDMQRYLRMMQQRPPPSAADMAAFRSSNPELISALNLRREIELKQASVNGGNVRQVDADTQEMLEMERSIDTFQRNVDAAVPPASAANYRNVYSAYANQILESPIYTGYQARLRRIEELQEGLRTNPPANTRARAQRMNEINSEVARANDTLLELKNLENAFSRSIRDTNRYPNLSPADRQRMPGELFFFIRNRIIPH
jgi:hypothetical protein